MAASASSAPWVVVPPVASPPFDAFSIACDAEHYWSRIVQQKCCIDGALPIPVGLVDVAKDPEDDLSSPLAPPPPRTREFDSAESIQKYVEQENHDDFKTRIFSIHQKHSWKPLSITVSMLRKIIELNDVMPEFLEIVLSFYERKVALEEAFSSSVLKRQKGDVFEVAYIFRYPEEKDVSDDPKRDPWSIRQTGVYHRYDLKSQQSTWILLHPSKEPPAHTRLIACLKSVSICAELHRHPLQLHNFLISTYLRNWRDYMLYYEKQLLPLSNTTMSTWIDESLRVNHQTLTSIRYLENRILPLPAIFASLSKTITTLEKLNSTFSTRTGAQQAETNAMADLLENYRSQLDAYNENATFLLKRSGGTAQQLADTLAFKNQYVAQSQSGYMLKLTMSTVDDSATVRVVTLVTLVYLPFSFMASVFGMNFFRMGNGNNIVISPEFWIYIVISIPITIATMMCWRWWKARQDAIREKAVSNAASMGSNEKGS
ncbi:hypothetical protein AOQ84DRAFT_109095 [Glonium stellatum]|uniref:CorA-like transporter domain-containing protein n=1 Tax=Glonium stellatum TaxID=574774 RepID=A0A8E2JQ13_9PEZI|nr:hypothetical protein AOQ84DRAFT_109095 [Glonium stellatum]